jgi:hypothetical protein
VIAAPTRLISSGCDAIENNSFSNESADPGCSATSFLEPCFINHRKNSATPFAHCSLILLSVSSPNPKIKLSTKAFTSSISDYNNV